VILETAVACRLLGAAIRIGATTDLVVTATQ
jgi:hypothetical protein